GGAVLQCESFRDELAPARHSSAAQPAGGRGESSCDAKARTRGGRRRLLRASGSQCTRQSNRRPAVLYSSAAIATRGPLVRPVRSNEAQLALGRDSPL